MSRQQEQEDHKAVVNHLRVRAYDDVLWWHTPNGERRDARTGAKLKAMGVRPGIPDIFFYRQAELLFVEQKVLGGRLSKAQKAMTGLLSELGATGIVSNSLNETLAFCEEQGLIKPDAFSLLQKEV